jgi:hypothetical protein
MSLLNDYEELCNAQDIGIFREALDEVLKPILIVMDERYFELNHKLGELKDKIKDLQSEIEDRLEDRLGSMDTKIEHELNYAYETHNTKLHNVWQDVLKIQGEIETMKLNLKK